MVTKVQKWGNSLALRIPRSFAEEAHLEESSEVDLSVRNGQLVVRAVPAARFTLEELLARLQPEQLHEEIDVGGPTGRERW